MEPGTWPNNGPVNVGTMDPKAQRLVDAWTSGEDSNTGIVVQGGTAPAREAVCMNLTRTIRDAAGAGAYVWSEYDFCDNYRMLRSLEDFAKRDRDPETWDLYVNYERKFFKLLAREVLYLQGLGENTSLFNYQTEYFHNEIVRRLTQTQYDSPRFTILSMPDVDEFSKSHRTFFEFVSTYCTVVDLGDSF